jgi:hypothetical protein
MRQRRPRLWVLLALTLLLGVTLVCSASGIAIRQRVVTPPEINLTIDGIGVIAHSTNVPSCALWFLPCRVTSLGPAREMYAVWVVWKPVDGPNQEPGARRIFAMKIDP